MPPRRRLSTVPRLPVSRAALAVIMLPIEILREIRISIRMDLKLSKYGYGVWAPFPLSMDHNMERWTTFHLNKTSVKGLYPLKLKKTRRNSIKVDF